MQVLAVDVVGVRHDDVDRQRSVVETLGPLLASPANRRAVFLGRGVPVLLNGLLVSTFTFCAGALLLGFSPGLDAVPALAVDSSW